MGKVYAVAIIRVSFGNIKAQLDGFLYVLYCLFVGFSLAVASGDRRAVSHEYAIFVLGDNDFKAGNVGHRIASVRYCIMHQTIFNTGGTLERRKKGSSVGGRIPRKDGKELGLEARQFMGDDIPDERVIDAKVVMDEFIAQSCEGFPVDLGMQ